MGTLAGISSGMLGLELTPAPATPASLAVGAVAFRSQLADSNRAIMEHKWVKERREHAKKI